MACVCGCVVYRYVRSNTNATLWPRSPLQCNANELNLIIIYEINNECIQQVIMVNICINVPQRVIKRWIRWTKNKNDTRHTLCSIAQSDVTCAIIIRRYEVHVYGVWTVDTPRRSSGISDCDSDRMELKQLKVNLWYAWWPMTIE